MTRAAVHLPVLGQYLEEQQRITVVDRFAQRHEDAALPANADHYEDLIPLTAPGAGEQYAFHVDLDKCTGCKACVTACHSLNGLDADEIWRSVGILHGGSPEEPMVQTVTTACHHCVDPGCAKGCPVNAYEKDELTGIVHHLDDQCIGCQYCTFTCPYEVPKYNPTLGIVRKCDMCAGRLQSGEAPACVQACPNEAISIRIAGRDRILEDAQANAFLPGAPSPAMTAPSTTYATKRVFPRNVLPADFFKIRPAHEHLPLVLMLVLTQLSVGAFFTELSLNWVQAGSLSVVRPHHALVALGFGLLAQFAAVFHLGRPRLAFRALIGLRTSWLSREILAFGAFAGLAVAYALSLWPDVIARVAGAGLGEVVVDVQSVLAVLVAASGAAGVVCSVMLYHATGRRWWNASTTGVKFFGTAAVLGVATTLWTSVVVAGSFESAHPNVGAARHGMLVALIAVSVAKLGAEASVLRHLSDRRHADLRRTAQLMVGPLGDITRLRFALGLAGGVALPALLLATGSTERVDGLTIALSTSVLVACIAAEVLERRLFFSAVSAPRMPGGVGG